jgi:hypothetical protein
MDDCCALSRYAPDDIDTDAKRKEKFLNGLKGELRIPLCNNSEIVIHFLSI